MIGSCDGFLPLVHNALLSAIVSQWGSEGIRVLGFRGMPEGGRPSSWEADWASWGLVAVMANVKRNGGPCDTHTVGQGKYAAQCYSIYVARAKSVAFYSLLLSRTLPH